MAPFLTLALTLACLTSYSHHVHGAPEAVESAVVVERRQNIVTDLFDYIGDFATSIQQYINQGIEPAMFSSVPSTISEVVQLLGGRIPDEEQEVEVLVLPSYANFTSSGWYAYIHGQAYTRPFNGFNIDIQTELEDIFIPDFLSGDNQIRDNNYFENTTSYALLLPKEGEEISLSLSLAEGDGGWTGWTDQVTLSERTDSSGQFDEWEELPSTGLPSGAVRGGPVGVVDVDMEGTDTGDSSIFLVPREGVTIVSDVDDVLRDTEIWDLSEAFLNTFSRPYSPWRNMPEVFNNWARQGGESGRATSISGLYHFHYLTTAPQQFSRFYMDFIYSYYPPGSFTSRPFDLSSLGQTSSYRENALRRIIQTFPDRKFVLIGDTTNNDILEAYPAIAAEFPTQVQCVLIRNTSATAEDVLIPYNTQRFQRLKQGSYMFFRTPEDIAGLNFANGDCRNPNVPVNVEFGWQGGPGGDWRDWIGDEEGSGATWRPGWSVWLGLAVSAWMGLM